MKATLLLLFDGKLEPWPHQVKAILRLEKERIMLLNKKKEDGSGQLLATGQYCRSQQLLTTTILFFLIQ